MVALYHLCLYPRGLIHLGFNMMVLFQVGPMLERELGLSRFFTLYTLTALTATGLGYFWHPNVTVIGASGSLFGLIGFSITYFHRMGPSGKPVRDFMLKWAVFAFVFGFIVGADNAGHLGGGLGGGDRCAAAARNSWPTIFGPPIQQPGSRLSTGDGSQSADSVFHLDHVLGEITLWGKKNFRSQLRFARFDSRRSSLTRISTVTKKKGDNRLCPGTRSR